MKVIFIKPHMEWNPGDEADLESGIAEYLMHVGVVTVEQPDNEVIEEVLVKKLKAVKKMEAKPVKKAKGRPKKAKN